MVIHVRGVKGRKDREAMLSPKLLEDYRGRRTSITDQNNKTATYAYADADRSLLKRKEKPARQHTISDGVSANKENPPTPPLNLFP